jgi:hypothetical protein
VQRKLRELLDRGERDESAEAVDDGRTGSLNIRNSWTEWSRTGRPRILALRGGHRPSSVPPHERPRGAVLFGAAPVPTDGALVPASSYPRMVRITLRGEANNVFPIMEEDIEAYLDLRSTRARASTSARAHPQEGDGDGNRSPGSATWNPSRWRCGGTEARQGGSP